MRLLLNRTSHPRLYAFLQQCNIHLHALSNKRKIRGRNNSISSRGAMLHSVVFDLAGVNNLITIGVGTLISGTRFFVRGSNHRIIIGSNCRIGLGATIWVEDSDCTLRIGDNTTIEEAHIALTEPRSAIEIGRDCMLAYDVDIRCGDSHSVVDLSTGKRINYAKDISIGDHVWIGAHVQVLKDVEIGSGSVIGVRSLVTEGIPPDSLAAGVPARVLKSNISWKRERTYED